MRVKLENIGIILHQPHFPENIGAAARAAKNMGISRLVVVDPLDCDLTRILKMATQAAEDLVADMEIYEHLADAVGPYQYVVGTTARTGSHRPTVADPRRMAEQLIALSRENRVALLFGPENRGLSNRELRFCHSLVTIPTHDFSSLNLAQAVMVICYEIFRAGVETPPVFVPRLATSFELEAMYEQLGETLARIHFINPENPDHWMENIRRAVGRLGLRARDVKIIRGVCRQINWYCGKRLEPGQADAERSPKAPPAFHENQDSRDSRGIS
jgi:tRNA/rRNA methyltransferase